MCTKQRTYDNLLNFSALSRYRNAIYGVAALWIVLFHYTDMSKARAASVPKLSFIYETLQIGNIGVDIFFFLSGVGLYYSFVKDHRVLRFYYKRLVRVMVPYLLLTLPYMTYLLIEGSVGIGEYLQSAATVSFWTGAAKRMNLWYVPVALAFYLIYPLIHKFLFCKEKGALARCLILAGISIAVAFLLWLCLSGSLYNRFDKMLPRLTVFILGCYFGRHVKEKKAFSAWVLFIGFAILLFAYPMYVRGMISNPLLRRYYGSLSGIMLVFLLSQAFELLSSIRVDRFFAFFGVFSLELYIAHIELRNWYTYSSYYGSHLHLDYGIIVIAAIVIAYLISLIEKPVTRLLFKPLQKN